MNKHTGTCRYCKEPETEVIRKVAYRLNGEDIRWDICFKCEKQKWLEVKAQIEGEK